MKTKILFTFLILTVLLYSCSNDENETNNDPTTVEISGKIIDESGNPLSGVQISSDENIATSNSSGTFTIQGTAIDNRSFVRASKTGFFTSFKGFKSDGSVYLEITMVSKGSPTNFNSSVGATLSNNGGTVSIGSNSLKNKDGSEYLGEVTAYIRFFSPLEDNFALVMQGGDFRGISTTNETGTLVSYGYFSIELEDTNGNKLNLKDYATASVSFQIDTELQDSAPATIPLWYFDEDNGVWKEEGSAIKNTNTYTGNVSHFSSWNFDVLFPTGTVKGKLKCIQTGQPLSNSLVIFREGTRRVYCHTNSQGEFQIDLPANIIFEIYLGSEENNEYWYGISVTAGYEFNVGTFEYYCQ